MFDVRVVDTDLYHLMGWYKDITEESVKQEVYLPKAFMLFVNNPSTNRKTENESDVDRFRESVGLWKGYIHHSTAGPGPGQAGRPSRAHKFKAL